MQTDSQATNHTGGDIRKQPITNAPNHLVRQKGEREREAHRNTERHANIQTVGQTSNQTTRQLDTLATTLTDTSNREGDIQIQTRKCICASVGRYMLELTTRGVACM